MIRITVTFPNEEAKALTAMCRGFKFDDAQYHLRDVRNVRPDHLCEAISRLLAALDATRKKP